MCAENKLYELFNLVMKIRGLMWRNKTFSKTWLMKYFRNPVTKVYARETTIILHILEFTNFSHLIA